VSRTRRRDQVIQVHPRLTPEAHFGLIFGQDGIYKEDDQNSIQTSSEPDILSNMSEQPRKRRRSQEPSATRARRQIRFMSYNVDNHYYAADHQTEREAEPQQRRICLPLISGATALASAIAAIGAVYISSAANRLSSQGQITDRLNVAVNDLAAGKTMDQLGGLYLLQRAMQGSARDQAASIQIISGYIRYHAPAHGANPSACCVQTPSR
jgi:hypothetical protein